ncbi:MAG: hypothetical protein H0X11_08160 [Betaproteobacteria bacterium]|nr:hypothetical protein [Betaproteobacteria bacterium]
MANPDAPFGFRVVRSRSGGPSNQTNEYRIASAYGTALATGDAVTLDTSGQVNIAAAGGAIVGIFQGCRYTTASGSVIHGPAWPASTVSADAVALVADDPGLVLEVQSDGSMTSADIGQLVNIDTSQSANTTNGTSRMQTSASGGAENQFRVYGVYGNGSLSKPVRDSAGNQALLATGTNAVIHVTIANHVMSGASAAVEV